MKLRGKRSVGFSDPNKPQSRGRRSVGQARLALLVMINIAQLWILSAAVEAGLAREFGQLLPLSLASAACFVISLTLYFWWRPIKPAQRNPQWNDR